MSPRIKIAILEDHLSIVDGYMYRLSRNPEIEVVATGTYGVDLESMLGTHPVDVLLLDINVPTSSDNNNPFPILHAIPSLLEHFPGLRILVITMLNQHSLIEALVDAGVSGYILKDDQGSIKELSKIVIMVAAGGVYFSQGAYRDLRAGEASPVLTHRQLEILSLCASYPDAATRELAKQLGISSSTLRNLLSTTYLRLGVRTRAAAIEKARQLGLVPTAQLYPNATEDDA
jgi:two-component system nitrate/nitrite response regulator NarL